MFAEIDCSYLLAIPVILRGIFKVSFQENKFFLSPKKFKKWYITFCFLRFIFEWLKKNALQNFMKYKFRDKK